MNFGKEFLSGSGAEPNVPGRDTPFSGKKAEPAIDLLLSKFSRIIKEVMPDEVRSIIYLLSAFKYKPRNQENFR